MDSATPTAIDISGLSHRFGSATILDGIDLSLEAGQVLALLGPSGCGKTTLLKLMAGLLAPGAGAIRIFGATVADPAAGCFLPPERRGLGMVFQDYALWPHLTVGRNVGFPLEMRRIGAAERRARVARALAQVGLAGFEARLPASLSGGQQQRVAIARAIVAQPRLVLFDEPLSNLDRELRDSLVREIGALVRGLGLSAVYVTHDHAEAFALADRIAVLKGGRIVQVAAPEALVERPAVPEVAEMLNLGPVVAAERREDGWWIAGTVRIADPAGSPAGSPAGAPSGLGSRAQVLLARRAVRLAGIEPAPITGTVTHGQFRGDHHLLTVTIGAPDRAIELPVVSERRFHPGEPVGLAIDPARLSWFAADATTPPRHSR